MEAIKLGLDIATNLFSLDTSIAIPASAVGVVKDLGLMAQRVQKFLNVMNAASKLYTGIATGAAGLKGRRKHWTGWTKRSSVRCRFCRGMKCRSCSTRSWPRARM